MNFAARFASICRISAGFFTTKRCWHTFAVHTLPFPGDPAFSSIKSCSPFHNLFPTTFFLPSLKTLMKHTARNAKPFSFHSFPLTSRPQDVPKPIHYIPVPNPWPSWPFVQGFFRQFSLDDPPQLSWYLEVVYILRFCVNMVLQGISFQVGFGNTLVSGYALFFNSFLFFG